MTRFDAVNDILHGIAKAPGRSGMRRVQGADEDDRSEKSQKRNHDALDAYCVNLNKKAKGGKIDPLNGREAEVDRTIQILCRRAKNNPLYVGDPGVGNTAIAEGLARRIVQREVPVYLDERDDLRARHGGVAGRHPVSRRFRGAALGGSCPSSMRSPVRSCSSTRFTL